MNDHPERESGQTAVVTESDATDAGGDDWTPPDAVPVDATPVGGSPERRSLLTGDDPNTVHARLDRLSHLLDEAFEVPGTSYRVGLDPLIGVLPVVGDAPTTALSAYIVAEAAALGVPRATLARMLLNLLLDATIGSLPVAGTLFDAVWKANTRNVRLLEARTTVAGDAGSTADRRFVLAVTLALFALLVTVGVLAVFAVAWLLGTLGVV